MREKGFICIPHLQIFVNVQVVPFFGHFLFLDYC